MRGKGSFEMEAHFSLQAFQGRNRDFHFGRAPAPGDASRGRRCSIAASFPIIASDPLLAGSFQKLPDPVAGDRGASPRSL